MGLLIGMDEAGYGPNLGPLVITATVWEVDGNPTQCDPWNLLSDVVTQSAADVPAKIHIADSKVVHQSSRGLDVLERSVLPLLGLVDVPVRNLRNLCARLDSNCDFDAGGEPWFQGDDLELPRNPACDPSPGTARFDAACRKSGIRLRTIRSRVVQTREFNARVREYDSKGVALSRWSLALLRSVWNPSEEALVICDKHGGRNRYDDLLAEQTDEFIFRVQEGRERSVYRVGLSEVRFQMKAEQHLPVAAASLVSKYLRETAMEQFNRYWQTHAPELKPTKGYPEDAVRFRRDTEDLRRQLGIPDEVFWRER